MKESGAAGPQNQGAAAARPGFDAVSAAAAGFSLIEALLALMILAAGLLSAGQMIYAALSSASLSRSIGTAAIAARSQLQSLADRYRRNPLEPDLSEGLHEGEPVRISNPVDDSTLNLYELSWQVGPVSDPRPGKNLKAKYVTVAARPIQLDGTDNRKARLNKIVSFASIISPGLEP